MCEFRPGGVKGVDEDKEAFYSHTGDNTDSYDEFETTELLLPLRAK